MVWPEEQRMGRWEAELGRARDVGSQHAPSSPWRKSTALRQVKKEIENPRTFSGDTLWPVVQRLLKAEIQSMKSWILETMPVTPEKFINGWD